MLNRIAEFRKIARLSQGTLAARMQVTQGAISNYETGFRDPGLDECRAIVKALNADSHVCTLDEVFPPDVKPTSAALMAWKSLDIAINNVLESSLEESSRHLAALKKANEEFIPFVDAVTRSLTAE